MRTDKSLLASWLPRHRVLYLSGRNLLLGLLIVLAGLALLGWCVYWINNARGYSWRSNSLGERFYKAAAELLLPASLGLVGLGIVRLLRFRLLLRLTQLLFGLSAGACCLVALYLLWMVCLVLTRGGGEAALVFLLVAVVPTLLASCCLVPVKALQHWLHQTRL